MSEGPGSTLSLKLRLQCPFVRMTRHADQAVGDPRSSRHGSASSGSLLLGGEVSRGPCEKAEKGPG